MIFALINTEQFVCSYVYYFVCAFHCLFILQHHCRKCGAVVCGTCSNRRFILPNQSDKPVRVCIACYNLLSASKDDDQLVFKLLHAYIHITYGKKYWQVKDLATCALKERFCVNLFDMTCTYMITESLIFPCQYFPVYT